MKLKNYNSQAIKILPAEVVNFTIPVPERDIPELLSKCIILQPERKPKISISRSPAKFHAAIKVNDSNIGKVEGLPEPEEGVILIVPSIIYVALHRIRKDIYVIDEPIRAEKGYIVACRSIARPRYTMEDSQIKGVANSFEASYTRILHALGNKALTPEEFRKAIITEEEVLSKSIVKLSNLTS